MCLKIINMFSYNYVKYTYTSRHIHIYKNEKKKKIFPHFK